MSNPSNLYAEKIFSEHPLVLWALDDKADYVSLISEANRNIETKWTVTSATADSGITAEDAPFADSISSNIVCQVPSGPTGEVTLVSPNILNFSQLDQDLGSFSIGAYFYSNSVYIKSLSIGFEYDDPSTLDTVESLEKFIDPIYNEWSFISSTFDIPDKVAQFRIILKIETIEGGLTPSEYSVFINGINIGQWSEEFNATSLGVSVSNFPSNIALDQDYAIEAFPYGLTEMSGYYMMSATSLFAKNTSIPLVYGASGVTKIVPNQDKPSVIIPGQGFLNEAGRYGDYTVEFWTRINSDTFEPKRIFGPIASSDGLYVESGFITLKIGNTFSSHFVGEWYRPMLINIIVKKNYASLLINGEEVVSLSLNTKSMLLPSIVDPLTGKSQDWLGFYAYEDVPEIEIDCVAIYPYQVPVIVAKRRWVYGQAVESPEGINSAYGGVSAFIDYSFANYTANYSYPTFAKWEQGTFDNVITTRTGLRTPDYRLPNIFVGSKTLDNFYGDNQEIQTVGDKFFSLKPNSAWDSINGYIDFPSLDIIGDEVHAVYSVLEFLDVDPVEQILIEIQDSTKSNKFSILKNGNVVEYSLTYNQEKEILYTTGEIPVNTKVAVGIDIHRITQSFGGNVSAFFGNKSVLSLYIGGNKNSNKTFRGYIYTLGISTDFNRSEIEDHFLDNGVCNVESNTELIDHTASYTLLPNEAYGYFFLDIGVSGHWEDYMPLSYFGKYVKNDLGNDYYDLDFLQFNLGYPEPSRLTEETLQIESFNYQDLYEDYNFPVQKTYEYLATPGQSGYGNYTALSQQSETKQVYDTSNSSVKSYITFQYVSEGANAPSKDFSTVDRALEGRILDIADHPNWPTTRFEVVNNTLIYPSKTIDFNDLAISYRLEFNIRGILTKPIIIKNLSIASKALNENSFNAIGTRFGNSLFPYKRSGIYFDYKSKNPYSIYKDSTPYLYMTKNSGIEIRGDFSQSTDRGLSLPVNSSITSNYRVSAFQFWYRSDLNYFTETPIQLFEINYKNDKIKFYAVSMNQSGTRAKIYAKSDSTGEFVNGLSYYINGSIVREPVITIKEWSIIGISFGSPLVFDSFLGSININGPGIFNNISYYNATNLQQIQRVRTRPWARVRLEDGIDLDWQYWENNYSWNGMLVVSTTSIYGVNPSEIYKTYIGTNKIIIDDEEGMIFDSDMLKIYDTVEWSSSVITAV
jgi:hypothetical protein